MEPDANRTHSPWVDGIILGIAILPLFLNDFAFLTAETAVEWLLYDYSSKAPMLDPEIFLKAATEIEVPVEECIVFEDAETGVLAAKNGGFYCIGLGGGDYAGHLSLADLIVTSFDDVKLDQINANTQLNTSQN